MGKVDQGVFTHWMLSHYFRRDLTYLGYGGKGKQVRDLISIDDVVDLVEDQLVDPDRAGRASSATSEAAARLVSPARDDRALPGADRKHAPDRRRFADAEGDVPIYLSDCNLLYGHTGWRPKRGPQQILEAIFLWIRDHERAVERARENEDVCTAIGTGSGGLIGSESVQYLGEQGFDVVGLAAAVYNLGGGRATTAQCSRRSSYASRSWTRVELGTERPGSHGRPSLVDQRPACVPG